MTRGQSVPKQWLIVDRQLPAELWHALGRLPRGSGVLLLRLLDASDQRRLNRVARLRTLTVAIECPTAARVHNQRELTQALLRRRQPLFISPIYTTATHPDWQSLPRMRAAALARLAGRRAIALGGLNEQRYAKIAPLGFIGWAGISAFRT